MRPSRASGEFLFSLPSLTIMAVSADINTTYGAILLGSLFAALCVESFLVNAFADLTRQVERNGDSAGRRL